VTLALLSPTLAFLFRLFCLTCRVEVRGHGAVTEEIERHGAVVLAFWHEVLPLAAWKYRGTGYHTLTSYSYDGELIARIIRHLGLAALRGSSSRGGGEALKQMETALRMGVTIGFTLDGPRGPRREAKPGVAVLAARSGIPTVPVALAATRCWRMKSWDRMAIPKPFSRIVCVHGAALKAPGEDDDAIIEQHRHNVERELNQLQAAIERELGMPV
jgi:hypothetical protein